MANTYIKLYVHCIFHVKTTSIAIQKQDLGRLFAYIATTVNRIGGVCIEVGGMTDHIHLLAALPKTMSLSDFIRTLKAESSRWLKGIAPMYKDFSWQSGYGGFSISPSLVDKTASYIRLQEKHHARRSFQEEYKLFLQEYGIEYDERYAFCD